jgi:hypothetical protein
VLKKSAKTARLSVEMAGFMLSAKILNINRDKAKSLTLLGKA